MRWIALVLLAAACAAPAEARPHDADAAPLRLLDDAGTRSDPLAPGDDVRAFVFVRRDCPIANRYAPELARLRDAFPAAIGRPPLTLMLVYVDPGDTAALIADHQREYGLTLPWFVDDQHALARLAGATVTPEAAVYSPSTGGPRQLLYRGRIDDRFIDVGRTRPAATTHDLRDAIAAALDGRRPAPAGGPAIGCFIEDAR
jgi:hypothetical protein